MSKAEVEQKVAIKQSADYKSFVERLESYTKHMPISELAGSDLQEYQALQKQMQNYVDGYTGKNVGGQRNK